MNIRSIFEKSIDRNLKGVIKVGQEGNENVKQELEEYVVTRELQKHFATFFSNYKQGIIGHTDKMGVWISGFFGSGKSHFLKIISYILENKTADGIPAIEYFEKVSRAVSNMMKVNSTDGMIVHYIQEHTPEKAIIFITGIGKCYPIIRSHTVLNNLHLVIDNVPVVLFYPGSYDGQELVLFDEIKDDNYYRAFRLV